MKSDGLIRLQGMVEKLNAFLRSQSRAEKDRVSLKRENGNALVHTSVNIEHIFSDVLHAMVREIDPTVTEACALKELAIFIKRDAVSVSNMTARLRMLAVAYLLMKLDALREGTEESVCAKTPAPPPPPPQKVPKPVMEEPPPPPVAPAVTVNPEVQAATSAPEPKPKRRRKGDVPPAESDASNGSRGAPVTKRQQYPNIPSVRLDYRGRITAANAAAYAMYPLLRSSINKRLDAVFMLWDKARDRRDREIMPYLLDPNNVRAVSSVAKWSEDKITSIVDLTAYRSILGWDVEFYLPVARTRVTNSSEVILEPGCFNVSAGPMP